MPEEIIKKAILRRTLGSSDANQIAASISRVIVLVHAELVIVVGVQAAAALCTHAVHRTRPVVKWTMPPAAVVSDNTLSALEDDLAARTPEHALFAGHTLLFALVDHLVSLIGQPLTRRMLHSALSEFDDLPPQEDL